MLPSKTSFQRDSTLPLCRAQKESCGAQSRTRRARVSARRVRVNRVDIDTCWFGKSCRLLLLLCPSVPPVVSMCLHVLRQFHRLHSEWGQMTNATAIKCCPSLGGYLRRHHQGVELAAQCASTLENSPGSDMQKELTD